MTVHNRISLMHVSGGTKQVFHMQPNPKVIIQKQMQPLIDTDIAEVGVWVYV